MEMVAEARYQSAGPDPDPRHRNAFLAEIKASTEAALRFEIKRIVVLTGNELPNVPRAAQHRSIAEGLKAAHEIVAPNGITMILEPLNTLVNHQGYYLNHTVEAWNFKSYQRPAGLRFSCTPCTDCRTTKSRVCWTFLFRQ